MRGMRGLYVIRGGTATPTLTAATSARADDEGQAAEAADEMPTLTVAFSRFDTWYEIDSLWEGRFLERTVQGSFKRTIKNNGGQVKVMFNHGRDMSIGAKVLGVPEVLEERPDSPHMEVPLLDTSYNRDLVPGLRAGAYGSSFMFEVVGESWNYEPEASDHNPDGLPERTITEVKLFEAGPVTWPANPDATAGLRSGADWLMDELAEQDAATRTDLVRSYAAFRALHGLGTPDEGPAGPDGQPGRTAPAPGEDTPARHVDGLSAAARRRRLTIDLARCP
ncbi:HK97 family phage prohead protease [Streptomyces halstedii]|uniref:HK97 family phage prohead protease n=1 Tax=Streptomyces halstedii TaxID=1944 RepID=UPI00334624C2